MLPTKLIEIKSTKANVHKQPLLLAWCYELEWGEILNEHFTWIITVAKTAVGKGCLLYK